MIVTGDSCCAGTNGSWEAGTREGQGQSTIKSWPGRVPSVPLPTRPGPVLLDPSCQVPLQPLSAAQPPCSELLRVPAPPICKSPSPPRDFASKCTTTAPSSSALPRAPSVGAPATPSITNSLAAATPPLPDGGASTVAEVGAGSSSCGGPHAKALGDAAAKAAMATAMCRRIQSFLRALTSSGLVMSALMALEVERSHPVVEESDGQSLEWTLAQMLALHLKAGYAAASEAELLAVLWTLESWGDVWRSPCTAVLQSYLRHLTTFDNQRAVMMSQDWPNQFKSLRKAMSGSQLDLLKKLSWKVRLDFSKETAPCHNLLFKLPQSPGTPLAAAASCPPPSPCSPAPTCAFPPGVAPAGGMRSIREGWVQRMGTLCAELRREVAAARAGHNQAAGWARQEDEEEEEGEPETPRPPKRQRCG